MQDSVTEQSHIKNKSVPSTNFQELEGGRMEEADNYKPLWMNLYNTNRNQGEKERGWNHWLRVRQKDKEDPTLEDIGFG